MKKLMLNYECLKCLNREAHSTWPDYTEIDCKKKGKGHVVDHKTLIGCEHFKSEAK